MGRGLYCPGVWGKVLCTLEVSSQTTDSGSTHIFWSSVSSIVSIPIFLVLVKFMVLLNFADFLRGPIFS